MTAQEKAAAAEERARKRREDKEAREAHRIQNRLCYLDRVEAREQAAHRAALGHPAIIRLTAILRTPCYVYDSDEGTQRIVIEAIDAVPISVRRLAFAMPREIDPFAPIVDAMLEVTDWSASLHAIGWIYGVSKERIRQLEEGALRRLSRSSVVRSMRGEP